jgi:NAD(P)-dependent dehydrogenase (short-subunit alcohol dehydrogenase family)
VNLYGTAYACQAFARELLKRKLPGRIALLSGGGATQPIENLTSYCASKAAVVRFGETLAQELRDHGITVNAIAPGAVNTAITETILEAGPEKAGKGLYERTLKQKQSGGTTPDKAAGLASYLMSEQSERVTGRLISAVWDDWATLHENRQILDSKDYYTLRRSVP